MRLSLRWRLTLWNTLALAVVLVGFSALVYDLLAHTFYERLDRALGAELSHLTSDDRMAAQREARVAYWIEEFRDHEKILCVVYNLDGTVYARTETLAADSIPSPPT